MKSSASTLKPGNKIQSTGQPRKILVPVDFSAPSTKAVQAAVTLAKRFGARLALVHVTRPAARPGAYGAAEIVGMTTDARRPAREHLADLAKKEIPSEIDCTQLVDSGVAHSNIAKAAREWNADLIVIGTHGEGWLPNAVLGSTAERVVRYAHCPVLVVRGREKRRASATFNPDKIRAVVVPTDFSENALVALPHALGWVKEFGARVVLTHVVAETLPSDLSFLGMAIAEQGRMKKASGEALAQFRQKHLPPDLEVETSLNVGNPAHEICRVAEEFRADLIVMASHGRTGFQHFWIGSVAERVVRHAPCAVLVIRLPKKR